MRPQLGEGLEIPLPTRDQMLDDFAKAAQPVVANLPETGRDHSLAGDNQLRNAPRVPPASAETRKLRRKAPANQ